MNTYGIYFSYGKTVLRLPVNPEELGIVSDSDNGNYNVLGIGEIVQPREPKLKKFDISGLFPAVHGPEYSDPEEYIKFFTSAQENKRVITFTPVRYKEDGTAYASGLRGFRCVVESFTYKEQAGETSDFYFDLAVTEYRDYTPRTVTDINDEEYTEDPDRSSEYVLTVGAEVVCNGVYRLTSGGGGPEYTASGYKGVINRIEPGKRYPYHVIKMTGANLGWFEEESITLS